LPPPEPLEAVLSDIFLTCFYRPLLIDKDQAFYMNYLWQIDRSTPSPLFPNSFGPEQKTHFP